MERGRASAARCVRRATHKQLGTAPARGDDRDERAQRVETRARVDVSSSRARRRRRRLIVLFVFFRLFCFVGRRLGVADGDAAASRGGVPRAVRRVRDRVGGGDAGGARVGRHERPERLHERGHADLPPRQVASAGRERACRSERRDSRRRSLRAQHGDERREDIRIQKRLFVPARVNGSRGQGRARWRRLWRSNLGWRCAERNRAHLGSDASFSTLAAPSSRLESSSDTRSSWADATAARGSSSSGAPPRSSRTADAVPSSDTKPDDCWTSSRRFSPFSAPQRCRRVSVDVPRGRDSAPRPFDRHGPRRPLRR